MQIVSKLPNVGTTIFSTMSDLAAQYNAINLGQGFPEFNPSPKLIESVHKAMVDGHNQYPSMIGLELLRQTIAKKIKALYSHQYDVDSEITITSGATEAFMSVVMAMVSPGQEVILLEPNYDSYGPAVQLAGGTPVYVPMQSPTDLTSTFSVDWNRVKAAKTTKTQLIVLNFPHNPTGAVLTDQDLDALVDIVKNTDIKVVSDEVYEHLVFDGIKHKSLASRPELIQRTFVISSFGKTTHTTGWKVGYCCAPKKLSTELRKVHQFMVFTVPAPLQYGLAVYTADPKTYESLTGFYQQKRDYLINALSTTRFKTFFCPATFFLLVDYSSISDDDESSFAIHLTKKHGVTAIPVSAFYSKPNNSRSNHQMLRLCFAKEERTLDSAIARLRSV